MTKWADYSFARPTIAELKAQGVVGVFRYIAPDNATYGGKILRPPERDALLGAGIDVALNWELYAGRCLEGYAAGVADGKTAASIAKALNYPAGKTIYFSHDTGLYDQSVAEYFKGVRVGLAGQYKLGAYGGYDTITALHVAGLIDKGWQTVAWSNGKRDPWAVSYQTGAQVLNGAADVDDVTSTDVGSWLDGPTGGLSVTDLQTLLDALAATNAHIDAVCGQIIQGSDPQHQNNIARLRAEVAAIPAAVWSQATTLNGVVQPAAELVGAGVLAARGAETAAKALVASSGTVTLDAATIAALSTAIDAALANLTVTSTLGKAA